MTRIPELHRLLVQGARFEEEQASRMRQLEAQAGRSRLLALAMRIGARRRAAAIAVSPARLRGEMRRLRVLLLSLVALLATATIALAATGVIGIGSPVRPHKAPRPTVGVGAPEYPGTKLLPLRVANPGGGLPWGMRIVHTTRGEVCLQVGRIDHGQLGVIGQDGAFHDDGKFHPLPADVLPEERPGGETDEAQCELAGGTFDLAFDGLASSAAPHTPRTTSLPRSELRNVDYGLLGPHAISVTYRAGGKSDGKPVTERVAPGTGAFLVVQPTGTKRGEIPGTGGGTSGSGEMEPKKPLIAITYREDGKPCEVQIAHIAHRCEHPAVAPVTTRTGVRGKLHVPLHVHLVVAKHVVTAAKVSFKAPYAIASARSQYTIGTRMCRSPGHSGYSFQTLRRDVRRGEIVSLTLSYPFEEPCGKRSTTIEAAYSHAGREGESSLLDPEPGGAHGATLVGKLIVKQPPGTTGERPRFRSG